MLVMTIFAAAPPKTTVGNLLERLSDATRNGLIEHAELPVIVQVDNTSYHRFTVERIGNAYIMIKVHRQ